jgi:hypothetical protein
LQFGEPLSANSSAPIILLAAVLLRCNTHGSPATGLLARAVPASHAIFFPIGGFDPETLDRHVAGDAKIILRLQRMVRGRVCAFL